MKRLELSDAEFQLLGSLIGHCFCGIHPVLPKLYDHLYELNGQISFDPPVMDVEKSSDGLIYLLPSMIGKVVSYNIPAGRAAERCRAEIEDVIRKYSGVMIDG